MQQDPRRRALFVFIGKRRQSLKILSWDGSGVVMFYKRLDRGTFEMPRALRGGDTHVLLSEALLAALVAGINTQLRTRDKIH